jgi:hypothetical protein
VSDGSELSDMLCCMTELGERGAYYFLSLHAALYIYIAANESLFSTMHLHLLWLVLKSWGVYFYIYILYFYEVVLFDSLYSIDVAAALINQ